ncbi:beta-galactosidase [Paenibacillus harenae]|uniref:Beta-galactosidase n=1 Tax=Paenibacillus harenae TaxID=306543 RepID=A0ABT9U2M9_PAEHA|nr:beta-galactosidase [Paenibacillus harenae]MDQ0113880.1 beta-galactosidase [Paenibacillus harenae]
MGMDIQAKTVVQFEAEAVRIHGKPQVLLSASLFYFRIPRAYWKERMEQLKAFGYNSIDVYFPWNYHEREEGVWDFGGERDISAFLAAAAETGLWVVARPGPYICSEWDGGALPAYLFAKDMKLRDNDSSFLRSVASWFDRILPLLKAYQAGEGGTVIAVQLDNELDFYDCSDPAGYMTALRDMALAHDIAVPIFACAGQGGLLQASGLVDGVVPTCNFYPDNRDPEFESKVLHYRGLLADRGYPLLVTETNRAHYLLRRLLGCGAKLLGPYLQVSGTDFGFTNATNNWGKPLAFMTSDYDFGGMISPEGHIRQEAYEGRLLGRLLEAYGASLAAATVTSAEESAGIAIAGESEGVAGPYSLSLQGGGRLLFVTNLEDRDKEIALTDTQSGGRPFVLKGGRSLALPSHLPLASWGVQGVIASSTAELYMAKPLTGGAAIAFHTDGSGSIELKLEAGCFVEAAENLTAEQNGGEALVLSFAGTEAASCKVRLAGGGELTLYVHGREAALYAEGLDERGAVRFGEPIRYEGAGGHPAIEYALSAVDAAKPLSDRESLDEKAASASRLETQGIYRGYAWYEASVKASVTPVHGVLIRQASDVISLYADGDYVGTATPGGGSRYMPLSDPQPLQVGKLLARTEIWGHTNFDDPRLPALRLNAMKGMTGMAAITAVRDLSRNWSVYRADKRELQEELTADIDRSLWPIVSFGGWLSPDHPAFEYYSRSFAAADDADSWTLHFQGLQSHATVYVSGTDAKLSVNPFDPYIDITPYVQAGRQTLLTVFVERVLGLPAGRVLLYEGVEATDWSVAGAEEQELAAAADEKRGQAVQAELPIALEPGATSWLYGNIVNSSGGAGWRVTVAGKGLKLTVMMEERIVGRLWLPSDDDRPVLTGGSPNSVYFPGAWLQDNKGKLRIWMEAVDRRNPGTLESISFQAVQC